MDQLCTGSQAVIRRPWVQIPATPNKRLEKWNVHVLVAPWPVHMIHSAQTSMAEEGQHGHLACVVNMP
jgi:hypothetical protein